MNQSIHRLGRLGSTAAIVACLAISSLCDLARADETVTFELENATLDDVQKAMDAGALTSVELVTLYLNRIEAYDKNGIVLNTVPAINPSVMAEAAQADALRAAGTKLGPLHGVPFTTKGSFNFEGMPNNVGLTAWADLFPQETCFVIKALQAKGAVFLGFANLDTFQASTAQANSQVWGLARNPYNPNFRTGGSSGGSGAATGGNLCFFSLGGETGGSVRSPSDRGGIVGIKTSNALISVRGLAPLAWDRDVVGPMARYAKDTAHIMDACVAEDTSDIWASVDVIPGRPRDSSFASKATSATLSGKRLGVPLNMLSSSTATVAVQTLALFAQARADLEAAGATIVEVTLPSHLDITFTGRRASVPPEVVTPPARRLYSPVTSDLTGNMVGPSRGYPFKTFLEGILATPSDTPDSLHDKVVERISPITQLPLAARNAIADKTTFGPMAPDSVEHFLAVRYQILDYEAYMEENSLDAFILPTAASKTATGITLPNISRALVNSFCSPFVTVPMGTVDITLSDTVTAEPSTLGFMGRFWRDSEVLALAAAYEEITKHRVNSPLVPPLEGENFEYVIKEVIVDGPGKGGSGKPRPVAAPPAKPLLRAAGRARIVGRDQNARLVVSCRVVKSAPLKSVVVNVAGRPVPVVGQRGWMTSSKRASNFNAVINVQNLLKRVGLRATGVNVSIVAKDANNSVGVLARRVALPTLDDYQAAGLAWLPFREFPLSKINR